MLRAILCFGTAVALTLILSVGLRGDDGPAATPGEQDTEAQIVFALQKKISLKLVDTPLRDLAASIGKSIGHTCLLDGRALDNVGIGDDVPVTFEYNEMSVRSVLNHVLRDLDLTWTITGGVLLITTPEETESLLQTKVIDVVDLVRVTNSWKEEEFDYDSLIDLITSTIEPCSWDTVGGPGTIEAFRGGLVISQTREVHEQIGQLLPQFRKARQLAEKHVDSPPPITAIGPADGDPTVAKIQKALAESIVPEFEDMPLEIVVRDIGQLRGINVIIDMRALDDVGIGTDVPISFHTGPIPLRDALRHILKQLDLTYVIRDEALVITTPEEEECGLTAKAYPVGDLMGEVGERDEFGDSRRSASLDQLIGLITSTVEPCTWDEVGGPGCIEACPHIDVLVISQTGAVHDDVADLLAKIRKNLAQQERPAEAPDVASAPVPTRLVVYTVPTELPDQKKTQRQSGKETDKKQSRHPLGSRSTLSQMGMGGMGGGGFSGGIGGWIPPIPPAVIPESELLGAIVELIEPQSWKERDDVYAKVLPGRLLIRHTDAVHRQIERLLAKVGVKYGAHSPRGMHYGGGLF
jgi:hypothetical protein